MTQTKNLPRETLLTSFLHRACNLSSSGLQIDCDGFLYASGEMIAAWRNYLFIDCGSKFVCNRRAANNLVAMAEENEIIPILYNTHSYIVTPEFKFVERMVSYPIWSTPKEVNPKNIFAQAKKILDKAIEKQVSFESIQRLVRDTQHIASLFGFTFDATQYETKQKQQEQIERTKKQVAAQYHFQEYTRLQQELEAS